MVRWGCALGAVLLVAGCQEFGGPLRTAGSAPGTQEARLQALEAKIDNLASQSQGVARLEAEVRGLRGEVERLRYEFETGEKRSRELYQDLDRRLARLEGGGARLSMEPRLAQPPPVPSSQEEEATYLAVFEQLKAGKYDDSIAGFRDLLKRWPQGRYADNARYWLGTFVCRFLR